MLNGLEDKEKSGEINILKADSRNNLKMKGIEGDFGTPPGSNRKTPKNQNLNVTSLKKISHIDVGDNMKANVKKEESQKVKKDTQDEIFYLWSTKDKIDFFHAAKKKDIFNLMQKRPKKKKKLKVEIERLKGDIEVGEEKYQRELDDDIRSRRMSKQVNQELPKEALHSTIELKERISQGHSSENLPTSPHNLTGTVNFRDISMQE